MSLRWRNEDGHLSPRIGLGLGVQRQGRHHERRASDRRPVYDFAMAAAMVADKDHVVAASFIYSGTHNGAYFGVASIYEVRYPRKRTCAVQRGMSALLPIATAKADM
jgi:hypothetical protein